MRASQIPIVVIAVCAGFLGIVGLVESENTVMSVLSVLLSAACVFQLVRVRQGPGTP